jgi:hypothetical protein
VGARRRWAIGRFVTVRHGLAGWRGRPLVSVSVAVSATALLGLTAAGPAQATSRPTRAATVVDLLPDLQMAPPANPIIDRTLIPGRTLLHFDATMVNKGKGAFEVDASRPDTSNPIMGGCTVATATCTPTQQRIFSSDGSSRLVTITRPSNPTAYWHETHNHWHIDQVERYVLLRSNGSVVGYDEKHGFCFFDDAAYAPTLPGAPAQPYYVNGQNTCGYTDGIGGSSSLSTTQGLSVGYSDSYHTWTPGQYIDITGVRNGTYTLVEVVDPNGWFKETNKANNLSWARLAISGGSVSVVATSKAP